MDLAQTSSADAPALNSSMRWDTGTGRKSLSVCKRARVGRAVIEHAKQPRHREPAPGRLAEKPLDGRPAVMRDDLGEVELRRHPRVQQVTYLGSRVCVRVGPAAEGQPVFVAPDPLAQLPGVLDASRRPDVASPPSTTRDSKPC